MDAEKIGMILESNKRFYNDLGGNFFSTRQNPWPGWKRMMEEIQDHPRSVLDLGCGNGSVHKITNEGYNHTKIVSAKERFLYPIL